MPQSQNPPKNYETIPLFILVSNRSTKRGGKKTGLCQSPSCTMLLNRILSGHKLIITKFSG